MYVPDLNTPCPIGVCVWGGVGWGGDEESRMRTLTVVYVLFPRFTCAPFGEWGRGVRGERKGQ